MNYTVLGVGSISPAGDFYFGHLVKGSYHLARVSILIMSDFKMTSDELKALLARPEGLKLEFKREYQLKGQNSSRIKAEVAKDLIALVNTQGVDGNEPAYLILGAGDQLLADGFRESFDVSSFGYTAAQFLDIVNNRCTPPVHDLGYEEIMLGGITYGVISLPASSEIHECTADLITTSRTWPKNSVLIRRGDQVGLASTAEIKMLELRKQLIKSSLAKSVKAVDPLRHVSAYMIHTPLDFMKTIGSHGSRHEVLFTANDPEIEREIRYIIKSIFGDLSCIEEDHVDMVMTFLDSIEEPLAALARFEVEIFCVIDLENYGCDASGKPIVLKVANYFLLPKNSFFALEHCEDSKVHRFSNQCESSLRDFLQAIRHRKSISLSSFFGVVNAAERLPWCSQCCSFESNFELEARKEGLAL